MHGALCAALVLAGRQGCTDWNDIPVRVLSPIDIRDLVGLGSHCRLFISTRIVAFAPDGQPAFWELARFGKRQLVGAQTREGVAPVIHAIHESTSNGLDAETAWKVAVQGFAHEADLTNLGNLRYESNFGKLKLEALWGPAIVGGFEGALTIGVVTVNGSLHLLHTSHAPIPFLLENIEQVLLTACE